MKSFLEFIRDRGVVGLAVGFILGGAVSQLVASLINDILNPLLGLVLGSVEGLKTETLPVLGAKIAWGDFVTVFINLVVISAVVFWGFQLLRLEKLDKPKEK